MPVPVTGFEIFAKRFGASRHPGTGLSSVSLVSVYMQIRISRFDLFRSSVFQIRISRLDLFSSSVFQIRIDGFWTKWQCAGSFQIRTPSSNPHFSSSKSALLKSAFCETKPHGRIARLLLDLLAHFAQLFESAKSVKVKSAKSAFSNPHAFFCQIRQIRIFKSASVFLSNPPNPHFQIRTGFGADLPCSELTDDKPAT